MLRPALFAPVEVLGLILVPSCSLSRPSITTRSPEFKPALKPTLSPVVCAIVTIRIFAVLSVSAA